MTNSFHEIPFTNKFGEIINPGDPVYFATMSYKQARMRRGFYRGVFISTSGRRTGNIEAVSVAAIDSLYTWQEVPAKPYIVTLQNMLVVPRHDKSQSDNLEPVQEA